MIALARIYWLVWLLCATHVLAFIAGLFFATGMAVTMLRAAVP